ncbi:MAG: hypothetical protein HY644_14145 [Acidobacteria bacterium]|nr:hypothetical protein [Acidobacteriota bacterium]
MIEVSRLKEFATKEKSRIRVFGKSDVLFFSISAQGEVDSAVVELIAEDKLNEFFSDALANAERFRIEGRFWKRELNRSEMQRLVGSAD